MDGGLIFIELRELRSVAMSRPGMMDAFLDVGQVAGTQLGITREDFDRLQAQWFPGLKLGSIVHKVLAPAVSLWDKATGSKLGNCGGCAQREMKLNAASSKLPP